MQAMKRIGKVFNEFSSDTAVMIVLEGDKALGDTAHHFYDEIIRKLDGDHKHVEHIQDFWGDPLTAAGSQSSDGKAAYVQVYLAGNRARAWPRESVVAVRKIVDSVPSATGGQGLCDRAGGADRRSAHAGDKSVQKVTMITFVVIILMLLFVYRSLITVFATMFMVVIELMAARSTIAVLGDNNIIGLSTFAVNILVLLAIAAVDRLCDIHFRSISRGAQPRRGPRTGLLHHVPRHRARRSGIGPDHRRCDVLPELYPPPVFPDARGALCGGHAGRRHRRAHPGPGAADRRQLFQALRSQAEDADPGLATGGHRHRPLAGADPRGVGRDRPHRSARPARLQTNYDNRLYLPAYAFPRISDTSPPNGISLRPD